MNVLYLHGLNGSLSDEKRKVLEKSDTVFAPTINYESDDVNGIVNNILRTKKIQLVIGNSMGGYVAYHVARSADLPCLLFNPALSQQRVAINFKHEDKYADYSNVMHVVLGKRDQVINYKSTVDFLTKDDSINHLTLNIIADLEHRIDVYTFENCINQFSNCLPWEM